MSQLPHYPLPYHSASSSSEANMELSNLPRTVRGAPPELRRAIRKRQNSESAKRCRERKKIQSEQAKILSDMQAKSLERLEVVVSMLSKRIDSTVNIVSNLASTIHGEPIYFAAPAPQPPQPEPQQTLATPLKRAAAMMDAGMQVAPAQMRAVQRAFNNSASSSISHTSTDPNGLVCKVNEFERPNNLF